MCLILMLSFWCINDFVFLLLNRYFVWIVFLVVLFICLSLILIGYLEFVVGFVLKFVIVYGCWICVLFFFMLVMKICLIRFW